MQRIGITATWLGGLWLALSVTAVVRAEDPAPVSEKEALAEIRAIGGILVHFDERQPDRPVIALEFSAHADFQEEWLKHLSSFPHLGTLGLAAIPLTDAGLKYLKNLPELDTLVLAGTKVSDAGLAELLKLKKLRHLNVQGTEVTAVGLSALQRFLPELEVESGPLPDNAAPTSTLTATSEPRPEKPGTSETSPTQDNSAELSAAALTAIRGEVAKLNPPQENPPEGWSKSPVDLAQLVALFPPLRLKPGLVLRAYEFHEEGNGNGVVWAMPAEAEFPEPDDCPLLEQHLLKAPKPSEALDDAMEAIESDGSSRSYLLASLLRRELHEFGAVWHGCTWSAHYLLDADPWQAGPSDPSGEDPMERPNSPANQWKWLEARPTQWSPQVRQDKDRVTVTFYTYSGLQRQSIYRHTDTYRVGKYRPKVEQKPVAEGPPGYVF